MPFIETYEDCFDCCGDGSQGSQGPQGPQDDEFCIASCCECDNPDLRNKTLYLYLTEPNLSEPLCPYYHCFTNPIELTPNGDLTWSGYVTCSGADYDFSWNFYFSCTNQNPETGCIPPDNFKLYVTGSLDCGLGTTEITYCFTVPLAEGINSTCNPFYSGETGLFCFTDNSSCYFSVIYVTDYLEMSTEITNNQKPNFINRVINFTQAFTKHSLDGFKQVPTEIKQQRLEICKTCSFFENYICKHKKCGCYLNIKTQWASSQCPIDKWSEYKEKDNG